MCPAFPYLNSVSKPKNNTEHFLKRSLDFYTNILEVLILKSK